MKETEKDDKLEAVAGRVSAQDDEPRRPLESSMATIHDKPLPAMPRGEDIDGTRYGGKEMGGRESWTAMAEDGDGEWWLGPRQSDPDYIWH